LRNNPKKNFKLLRIFEFFEILSEMMKSPENKEFDLKFWFLSGETKRKMTNILKLFQRFNKKLRAVCQNKGSSASIPL